MNEKWFSLEISDVEKKLKTNAALGLTRKAARSRARKEGINEFFHLRRISAADCIKKIFWDPMLILIIAVDIIAAVFGSVHTAITCAFMIAINVIASIFLYIKSCRISESMAEYSQPRVKLIREGKLYRADSRAIVRGDVILLSAGDILPCDARIVSCDDFTVSCYDGARAEDEEKTVIKNADALYDPSSTGSPHKYDNMVYAGSSVIRGTARAIVVETGDYTYIGALDGGVPLNNSSDRLDALKKLKRISKIYSFILMAAMLPLTVIGIFTFGAEHLLDTFMLIMAVSVSSLGELIYVIGGIIVSAGLIELATDKDDPSVVKNISSLGSISDLDYIFLLDDAALSDGSYRIIKLIVGDSVLECKNIFSHEAKRCAELIMLTEYSRTLSPSAATDAARPLFDAVSYYGQKIGIDKNSFPIRMKNSTYYPANGTGGTESASLLVFGERVSVFISESEALIDRCAFIRTNQGNKPFDISAKEELKAEVRKLRAMGYPSLVCASSNAANTGRPSESGLSFEGITAFGKNRAQRAEACKNALQQRGVRTVIFSFDKSKMKAMQAARLLGCDPKREIVFSPEKDFDIAENIDNYSVFTGVSLDTVRKAISKLQKSEKRVAVVGINTDSLSLLESADVSVSYGVSPYRTAGIDISRLDIMESPDDENKKEGAQTMRFMSDALINRANAKSGGLCSVYNMIRCATGIHVNLDTALTYLICAQLTRTLIAAVASVFSGILFMTPAQLLFSGLLTDLGAAVACAFDSNSKKRRVLNDYSPKNIFKLIKAPLLSSAVASAASVVVALIISLVTQKDVSRAVFFSVILMQAVMFCYIRYKNGVKDIFTKPTVAVLATSILLSAVISLITPISAVFGAYGSSFLSLVIIPVAPAVFCTMYFLLTVRKSKDQT